MKLLFLILTVLVASCGKNQTGKQKRCLSRIQKMQECYQAYNNTHDPRYVEAICGQQFPKEGCY